MVKACGEVDLCNWPAHPFDGYLNLWGDWASSVPMMKVVSKVEAPQHLLIISTDGWALDSRRWVGVWNNSTASLRFSLHNLLYLPACFFLFAYPSWQVSSGIVVPNPIQYLCLIHREVFHNSHWVMRLLIIVEKTSRAQVKKVNR